MLFVVSIGNLKNLKYHTFSKKIICSRCENEKEKIFKKEESVEIQYQKFSVLLEMYNYFKNMTEENISQEIRLKV